MATRLVKSKQAKRLRLLLKRLSQGFGMTEVLPYFIRKKSHVCPLSLSTSEGLCD